jgi:hypothetical protein
MANYQLGNTQKAPYTVVALDSEGNVAVPVASDVVTVISTNTAALTVTPDAVAVAGSIASGFIAGVAPGGAGISVTATLTHADGTSVTVSQMVDVGVPGAAATLTLTFGAPVAQ